MTTTLAVFGRALFAAPHAANRCGMTTEVAGNMSHTSDAIAISDLVEATFGTVST
jgi:hypothetical protein